MTVRRVAPRPRPWSSGLACLLVMAAALGGAPAPAVAAPPYRLDERAVAIAEPALVYVEMVYTGYVRDTTTRAALRNQPVTVNRRCSGFVVNPAGYVVTNGVCLQPGDAVVRQSALYALGRALIGEEQLDPKELDQFVDENDAGTLYTGRDPAAPPDRRVFAQFNVATGNLMTGLAVPGRIVGALAADQGNVALVKLPRGNLPAVELTPDTEAQHGSELVAIGFDDNDSGSGSDTYAPRWKSVQLTGVGTRGLVPVYRVNGDVGSTSRGGMLIDTSGRAVGMIDSDEARSDRAERAAIRSATIADLLKHKGVANTLGDADRRYREGLDAYFAGRYSRAIAAFETVIEQSPDNQVARRYRQNALDRREIEGEVGGGLPTWLAILLGAAGGIAVSGLVAAAVIALRRRGARRRPVTGFAPYPYAPVSAAPMSGSPVFEMPMSDAPMAGISGSGYPQRWQTYRALPQRSVEPLDEHGLPAYSSGGQQDRPRAAEPPQTGVDRPSRAGE